MKRQQYWPWFVAAFLLYTMGWLAYACLTSPFLSWSEILGAFR